MPKTQRKAKATSAIDLGPDIRRANGTALIAPRADPERPNAPDMRAARALIRYEHMSLDKPAFLAAERIALAAEAVGICNPGGAGGGSLAHWQRDGMTERRLEAADDLRAVWRVCGRLKGHAVIACVVMGHPDHDTLAREGLALMADHWRL